MKCGQAIIRLLEEDIGLQVIWSLFYQCRQRSAMDLSTWVTSGLREEWVERNTTLSLLESDTCGLRLSTASTSTACLARDVKCNLVSFRLTYWYTTDTFVRTSENHYLYHYLYHYPKQCCVMGEYPPTLQCGTGKTFGKWENRA